MLFYTRWDTKPGQRNPMSNAILSGFATVGIVMLVSVTTNFIAPNFVNVEHGLRQVNDCSPTNCLGPKPRSTDVIPLARGVATRKVPSELG